MEKRKIFLFILGFFLFSVGCGKKTGFHLNEVPTDKASLRDFDNDSVHPKTIAPSDLSDSTVKPGDFPNFQEKQGKQGKQEKQEKRAPEDSASESTLPQEFEFDSNDDSNIGPAQTLENNSDVNPATEPTSELTTGLKTEPVKRSLTEIAKWVIQYEAKKVGAACNFFIQRIFNLMGFGSSSWTANEFDQYVKSNFQSYKEKTFVYGSAADNQKKLKEYIWSFPEHTGLIFQWKRTSGHGHIAVVQRIQNELVIYHASLNTFRPKAQSVTVDILLKVSTANLNVFSDFEKKP